MKKSVKLAILTEVRNIINTRADRRPGWFNPAVGLCYHIEMVADRLGYPVLGISGVTGVKAIKSWPHYSGDIDFPVPATTAGSPSSQYFYRQTQYDRRSPYCRLRYDLLDYVIECVDNE